MLDLTRVLAGSVPDITPEMACIRLERRLKADRVRFEARLVSVDILPHGYHPSAPAMCPDAADAD